MYAVRKPRVKPTRVSPRPPTRFGSGILPNCPRHEAPASLSDLEWYAGIESVYGDDQWDTDTILDQQWAEAEAVERLCNGFIPRDLAEMISETRI
jgi:hypothetical protein